MTERGSYHLQSREGAPLHTIANAEFEAQQPFALKHTELQPDTLYTAHVTSQLLRSNGYGLRFETHASSLGKPLTPFAVASFQLLLLNEDYRPVSSHVAEIDPQGNWFISNPDSAISVRRSAARHIIDRVRQGYLIEHVSDEFDSFIHTFEALHTPTST